MEKLLTIKKITGLTEMEIVVLTKLADLMYAEIGFSDVNLKDLVLNTNIPEKQIRGVLSSLIKKELLFKDTFDNWGDSKKTFFYLANDACGLVERWQEELEFKSVIV